MLFEGSSVGLRKNYVHVNCYYYTVLVRNILEQYVLEDLLDCTIEWQLVVEMLVPEIAATF